MRKTLILIIFLISFCTVDTICVSAKERNLTYHSFASKDSKEVIAVTTIKMKDLDNGGLSIIRNKQSDSCMVEDEFILDNKYDLQTWNRTCYELGTNFSAVRSGELLFIRGQFKGEAIEREIELGQKSLYIYPKFSLSKLALSNVPKLEFWAMRRDKLKKLPMRAIHKGEGVVIINGKEINAVKIYYHIVGKLREKYYNHNYYFRKSDGLFIKKREQDGRIQILVNEK